MPPSHGRQSHISESAQRESRYFAKPLHTVFPQSASKPLIQYQTVQPHSTDSAL